MSVSGSCSTGPSASDASSAGPLASGGVRLVWQYGRRAAGVEVRTVRGVIHRCIRRDRALPWLIGLLRERHRWRDGRQRQDAGGERGAAARWEQARRSERARKPFVAADRALGVERQRGVLIGLPEVCAQGRLIAAAPVFTGACSMRWRGRWSVEWVGDAPERLRAGAGVGRDRHASDRVGHVQDVERPGRGARRIDLRRQLASGSERHRRQRGPQLAVSGQPPAGPRGRPVSRTRVVADAVRRSGAVAWIRRRRPQSGTCRPDT